MDLIVPCHKCGVSIAVSDAQINEAKAAGVPLEVVHAICPRDQQVLPQYVVTVTVTKVQADPYSSEVLAEVSGSTFAESFAKALPEVNKALDKNWAQAQGLAGIAET